MSTTIVHRFDFAGNTDDPIAHNDDPIARRACPHCRGTPPVRSYCTECQGTDGRHGLSCRIGLDELRKRGQAEHEWLDATQRLRDRTIAALGLPGIEHKHRFDVELEVEAATLPGGVERYRTTLLGCSVDACQATKSPVFP